MRAGDAARALLAADDDPGVQEVLGRAAYLDLDFAAASEHWQRAYAGSVRHRIDSEQFAQQLLGAMHGNQDAIADFVSVVAATLSPVEFFDPDRIGRVMATANATTACEPLRRSARTVGGLVATRRQRNTGASSKCRSGTLADREQRASIYQLRAATPRGRAERQTASAARRRSFARRAVITTGR